LVVDLTFGAELVRNVMSDLKCGKAPDTNGLSMQYAD